MSRLVPGMRIWNRASGLKHKENGNALLLMLNRDGNKVLVKIDSNLSYYWWRTKSTYPATNQPDPIITPDIPSNAFNQATRNMNKLTERAYAIGRYSTDPAFDK